MVRYNPQKIEKKWQKRWEEEGLNVVKNEEKGKENYYLLVEFPYPSGNLHVGHWYAFSVPDIFARAKRMQGYNVLYPFGFDAFGLPAENAAIKRGLNPRKWTYDNIEYMRGQTRLMGASFDPSREVVTCDPEYYRWTQWLFLQLFKNDLAVQKKTEVNWCPSCKTVLANEQVVTNSAGSGQVAKCERCGTEIMQKEMKQWNLKITDYADRLLDDLEGLDWSEDIKQQQKNWIGRSHGASISFPLRVNTQTDTNSTQTYTEGKIQNGKSNVNGQSSNVGEVDVFTTRVDTIFGCTYLVVAPESNIISDLRFQILNWDEVEKYIEQAKKKTTLERTELAKEKTGVRLEGVEAINPFNGESVPVFVADYVLGSYGTGAVMAVPAHDERDFIFSEKNKISMRQVIVPDIRITFSYKYELIEDDICKKFNLQKIGDGRVFANLNDIKKANELIEKFPNHKIEIEGVDGKDLENWLSGYTVYTKSGNLIDSGEFTGLTSEEAREKMSDWLEKTGNGKRTTQYKLRDWTVSRQRYWGVPIPIVHCSECGVVSVPEDDLPLKLPEIEDYMPREDGKSPLAKAREWVEVPCPKCGGEAERETDTLDTFVCSSWYFLAYTARQITDNKEQITKEGIGRYKDEFKKWLPVDLYSGGAEHTTMHLLYSRFFYKALADLGLVEGKEPYMRRMNRGLILGPDGNKMSKSKGNVIDPDDVVKEFGADSMRLYLAFIGPYNVVGSYPWNTEGVSGVRRFLEKTWRLFEKVTSDQETKGQGKDVEYLLYKTIKKVTEDIEAFRFNTAISAMMILVNVMEKEENLLITHYSLLTILLSPFAPHISEDLWEKLGNKQSIFFEKWPTWDEKLIQDETITLVVQVNGKVRNTLEVSADISEDDAREKALASPRVQKFIEGKEVRKVIFVPGRLINIVI